MSNSLLTASASELARRIRSGEVSSIDVVEQHIHRIEEVNSRLNAVVSNRFAEAREEARAADRMLAKAAGDPVPPFHGVPCSIKESIGVKGMPNSSGVFARKGVIAGQDASTVSRLRAAGAIPLGVTNIPELTAWTETFNKVYGRTNNAYAVDKTAGGSSGGEGAIVGAGGAPFGLGTDIGGSIRIPSFCNGVFGHKPSGGLVPSSGQFPGYEGEHCRFNTTGPIARRAEDLMPLLRILSGPDGVDSECRPMALGDPATVSLERTRVLLVEGDGRRPAPVAELLEAQRRAANALAARGTTIIQPDFPALRKSLLLIAGLMLEGGRGPIPVDLGAGDGKPVAYTRELLRLATGRSRHISPVVLTGIPLRLLLRFPGWIRGWAQRARTLRSELEQALGDDGVMLYPMAPDVAPPHGRGGVSHFRFTGLFNVLEMPVTQVPLGLGSAGLPLGIQVVGARGQDHRTIAIALQLERALGGWVPPPGCGDQIDL